MDDFIHHLIHFIMYSLVLWQVVLGVYIILLWAKRNIKFEFTRSPVLNIGESFKKGDSPVEESRVNKALGPVEVDIKKEFKVDTNPDEKSVEVDEKIKGKVKTQKDKLRNLRK